MNKTTYMALILTGLISPLNTATAQVIKGWTDNGERIILKSDGTWKIDKKDTSKNGLCAELIAKLKTVEREASYQRESAERERYLAVADALAIKSRDLRDPQQKGLVALQAYNFNTKYKGYPFRNSIYDGVFHALEVFDHPMTRGLEGHQGPVSSLVTNMTDSTFYSAGGDGKILHWILQGKTWTANIVDPGNSDLQVLSIDVSPDGRLLAVGGLMTAKKSGNYVKLYDLKKSPPTITKIVGFGTDVDNIRFTPDSKGFYARCNAGRSVMFSNLATSKEVIAVEQKVNSIDLSPNGTRLAAAGIDGNLYVWDIQNNYATMKYSILNKPITTVAFLPTNNGIVIGDENGEVRIVDGGITKRVLSGHDSWIQQIRFSHSGVFMATAGKDNTIRVWNMKNLNQAPLIVSNHEWAYSLAFSPSDAELIGGLHTTEKAVSKTNYSIGVWPTEIRAMAAELCLLLKRNMTTAEWQQFAGEVMYEPTCANKPANNK